MLVVEGGDKQGAGVGGVLDDGDGQGEGGESIGGGQVEGGGSGPGVTAVSIKNKEPSGSFMSSNSGGSVSQIV
jgi:hypothetical protein